MVRVKLGETIHIDPLHSIFFLSYLTIIAYIDKRTVSHRDNPFTWVTVNLLPELFTLTQLQLLYEAILGEEIDKRNFRKRIKGVPSIQKTEFIDKNTSKRGAYLYRFSESGFIKDAKFVLK